MSKGKRSSEGAQSHTSDYTNNQVLRQHTQVRTIFQMVEIAIKMHIREKLRISNKKKERNEKGAFSNGGERKETYGRRF